jgi:hypothetical protein
MAAQRRIELVADFQTDIPAVTADPVMLQFLLFCLMEEQIIRLKPKGRLVFGTARSGKVLSVMIHAEGEEEAMDEKRMFPEGMAQLIAKTYGYNLTANGRNSSIIFNL